MKKEVTDEELIELTRALTDRGKLIAAGWIGYKTTLPKDASLIQVSETRAAFFAGAAHLFSSVLGVLEPGEEPSEKDLERMDLISKELLEFQKELEARVKQMAVRRN